MELPRQSRRDFMKGALSVLVGSATTASTAAATEHPQQSQWSNSAPQSEQEVRIGNKWIGIDGIAREAIVSHIERNGKVYEVKTIICHAVAESPFPHPCEFSPSTQ